MIDIDITMPIHIFNTLLLIVIMNAILYKPIRTILAERKKKINGLQNDIETFDKNAELRLEEFNNKMKDAHVKAKAALEEARSEAQSTGAEKLAKIRQESDAAKAEQLSQIETQFKSVQDELKGQIEGFANEMATKILGRAV